MTNLLQTLLRTAPLIHPGRRPMSLLKQTKHILRGLLSFKYSKDWFKVLQSPELEIVARQHPYLFQKLQRPYLHRRLNTAQRFQALQQHYQFVRSRLTPATTAEIYAADGKLLAELPLEGIGQFELRLGCSRKEKEGDLTVGLIKIVENRCKPLFTLSFSITEWASEPREIFIGGLQGDQRMHDKDMVVAITRESHGLRPKALLLFALQTLAVHWDIAQVRAVSDEMHIYRHWRKRRTVKASYNKWWAESGGQLAGDGNYDLPEIPAPREISTLKSNKRQLYKRRYRMLENIRGQITGSGV